MILHHALEIILQTVAWIVAISWWFRVVPALIHVPRLPDLRTLPADVQPSSVPSVTVIVPARNEETAIRETLESLLQQDYPNVSIVAVDDRSTDATGSIMDSLVASNAHRLRVIHITDLPSGWTGKVHAMSIAASKASTDWLLFTDGDVSFAPDALRRSFAMAEKLDAEHFVTLPTMEIRRWDEAMLLGFFQIFSLQAVRPWKVADPKAKRDCVGIGAFNMVRRRSYDQIGGFASMPMEVLEDMRLGRDLKLAGVRSRVAFGRDLVRVHWASGVSGLIGVMTKNIFSAFRFHASLLLLACLWMAIFCIGPFLGVITEVIRVPSVLAVAAMATAYWIYAEQTRISTLYVLLAPFAAALFIYTLLRSMTIALKDGGVTWRGTFYPLHELREHAGKLW